MWVTRYGSPLQLFIDPHSEFIQWVFIYMGLVNSILFIIIYLSIGSPIGIVSWLFNHLFTTLMISITSAYASNLNNAKNHII